MIKFIFEDEERNYPTFGDVKIDQFFVHEGRLLQKENESRANLITNTKGTPYSSTSVPFVSSEMIDRILPRVKRIEY